MSLSLFERIAQLKRSTAADRKLAEYFTAQFPNLAFSNLDDIARGAGVSVSTVTRFVRKLGYENFKSFSASIREEVATNFDRPLERGLTDSVRLSGEELSEHLDRVIKELTQTKKILSSREFNVVADLISDEQRPLFVTGIATSRGLIRYFYLLTKYHRRNVVLLDGPDMHAHELLDIDEKSVLFATNFDRHPRAIDTALQVAHERGATTILLTNRAAGPLYRYADHVLLVDSDPAPRFKSRVPIVAVLEALLAAMENRLPEHTVERTRRAEEIIDRTGLFLTPQR